MDIGPYSTATEMLEALETGVISSVELVEMHLDRIEALDGPLNALPVLTPDRAIEAARRADTARASGRRLALDGLPVTLKESTQVAGLPQSAGIEELADHRPTNDGPIAQRVFGAGACLLGKTNIPVALGDWQADSPVYGRTNNPWDLERTPGGSTGGGSAALAAGMTPLEIGSDIGGSVRVPAAYCGVYGHRPSETAIPRAGGFPFAELANPATIMAVQGPMARSGRDLELLFDVVTGPVEGEDVGWVLDLPPARHERLAEFRVAVMPPLTLAQPSDAMQTKCDELASLLDRLGATVGEALPDLDHEAYFHDYLTVLTLITALGRSPEERTARAAKIADRDDAFGRGEVAGLTLDAPAFIGVLERRELARRAWRAFFAEWDVLVSPAALDVAFAHQTGPQGRRTLAIDERTVPYLRNIVYPMWPILPGLPATAFPAGLGPGGLPLGLQAIGPYLEDRTTLRFVQVLEDEWHRFEPPPGY